MLGIVGVERSNSFSTLIRLEKGLSELGLPSRSFLDKPTEADSLGDEPRPLIAETQPSSTLSDSRAESSSHMSLCASLPEFRAPRLCWWNAHCSCCMLAGQPMPCITSGSERGIPSSTRTQTSAVFLWCRAASRLRLKWVVVSTSLSSPAPPPLLPPLPLPPLLPPPLPLPLPLLLSVLWNQAVVFAFEFGYHRLEGITGATHQVTGSRLRELAVDKPSSDWPSWATTCSCVSSCAALACWPVYRHGRTSGTCRVSHPCDCVDAQLNYSGIEGLPTELTRLALHWRVGLLRKRGRGGLGARGGLHGR